MNNWRRAVFLVDINRGDRGEKDYYVNPLYHMETYQQYIKLINRLESDKDMYADASGDALNESERVKKEQAKALERFLKCL